MGAHIRYTDFYEYLSYGDVLRKQPQKWIGTACPLYLRWLWAWNEYKAWNEYMIVIHKHKHKWTELLSPLLKTHSSKHTSPTHQHLPYPHNHPFHSITHSHSSISVIPSTSFTPTLFTHSRYSTFVETLFPPFLHLYNLYSIRTSCSLLPLVLSGTCPLTHSHT